ncbi:hypothetical protein D3C84_1246940 [compost metagenome]
MLGLKLKPPRYDSGRLLGAMALHCTQGQPQSLGNLRLTHTLGTQLAHLRRDVISYRTTQLHTRSLGTG